MRHLIFVWTCFVASDAIAAVVPAFDTVRETILVDQRSTLAQLKGLSAGLWYPEQGSLLKDGTVRVRLRMPKEKRAVVIAVRAANEATGMGAYGIALQGRYCQLVELRADAREPMGKRVMIARSSRPRIIEVVLSFFADAVVVNIFDPNTGKRLATTSATGLEMRTGRVAIWADAQSDSAVHLLSTRAACDRLPPRPVVETEAELPIVITVAGDDEPKARAHASLVETLGEVIVLRTQPVGLEHLFCDGVPLRSVRSELPWKYIDLTYLQARDKPPVATDTGYRLDVSYKNPKMVEELLRGWHARYPNRTRLEVLGHSHRGYPVMALAIAENISEGDPRPSVLLAGAYHGDELLGTDMVLDAARALIEEDTAEVKRWRNSLVVYAVPVVNPDGLEVFLEESPRAGRKNGRDNDGDGKRGLSEGVDLNRNFPLGWERPSVTCSDPAHRHYRGPHPASEPETQAVMRLAERERFVASLSYHMGNVVLLAPYTIGGAENPVPNVARLVAEELARDLGHPQGKMGVRHSLHAVQGTDQDWLRHEHGTVAILVEAATWPPPTKPRTIKKLIAATRPIWQRLLQRITRGPTLHATVVDALGNPLEVTVELDEVELRANEKWTTRPRDGAFVQMLPRPGEYTLRVDRAGPNPVVRTATVSEEDGSVHLKIVMPSK